MKNNNKNTNKEIALSKSKEESSIFDKMSLDDIYKEIQQVYLEDSRPWVIGYSGGKDSTTALQLTWYAISKLPKEKRKKKIYVISSDTLVETPVIVDYINNTLENINEQAEKQNLPFIAEKVMPAIKDTFWVNLIGRGYPAPQTGFRWCTERMKIKPADKFIQDKVSKYGEIITVLGIRKGESMTRDQVMSLYEIKDSLLSKHSRFPNAFVYTPIKEFTINDIWKYLLQNPSPWGGNNRDLVALYKNAQSSGECPLVVDDTTPSCGNTRFGCWVCTVVSRDKSMEALIDSGEEWMEPLLEIRDYLSSTQDPSTKKEVREFKRRMGFISIKNMYLKEKVKYENKEGEDLFSRGPYKLEICKKILSMLLKAQVSVRKTGPDPSFNLILPEELYEIRKLWTTERGDWEDSVPQIYRETTGSDLNWVHDDIGLFNKKDHLILKDICTNHKIPEILVQKLMEAERQTSGMNKRSSIFKRIEDILKEEWRDEDEVTKEVIEEFSNKSLISKMTKDKTLEKLEQKNNNNNNNEKNDIWKNNENIEKGSNVN